MGAPTLQTKDSPRMATVSEAPNRLLEIRELLQLSKRELAKRAQVAPRTIGLVETGGVQPQLETARRISQALGCALEVVFPPPAQ